MKKAAKKILSLVLSAVLVAGVFAPSMAKADTLDDAGGTTGL